MARLISDEALAICTLWQEARGEAFEGKVAVGEVIRNRMKERHRWSVAQVVLEPLQFSGWNAKDVNRIFSAMIDDEDPIVIECREAWERSATSDLTEGATLYFAPKLAQPGWAARATFTVEIGAHRFYREG